MSLYGFLHQKCAKEHESAKCLATVDILVNFAHKYYHIVSKMFKLGIKNFRGFLDNEFAFSRVNILIGENSAGKSSLLKFLLALKQSLLPPNSRDYNLTLAGEEVDLGNYEEVIYNHEVERNLSFSFEFGEEYIEDIRNYLNTQKKDFILPKMETPTKVTFTLNKELSNPSNIEITISNDLLGTMRIVRNENINTLFNGKKPTCSIYYEGNATYKIENVEYEQISFFTVWGEDAGKIENTVKASSEIFMMYLLDNICPYLNKQLHTIEYANNPDFDAAKRIYFKRDKKMKETINNIEELIYLLGGDGFLQGEILQDFTQEYVEKLQAFGIVDNLYLKKIDSVRELRVVVNGIDSNITDVGFGVSLQLPIIAQAILAEKSEIKADGQNIKKGKLLLIEQPEIHLHPSLQAKFMDSLLQIGDNNMYFIETHSEHIVRKLQVLVKEGKYGLKPEDVCIHYFRKENGHIVTTLHTIDQATGKLSPKFPSGFYDVSTNLAYELIS